MKKITILSLLNIFILGMSFPIYSQFPPSLGGYNIYFGNLHNHTTLSDSTKGGPPELAYNTAKNNGLDFYGISDYAQSLIDDDTYNELIEIADNYNDDNVFVTFYGYEFTSGVYGHITVVNTDLLRAYWLPDMWTFDLSCNWLSMIDCIAILNHPGYGTQMKEFGHFNTKPSDNIVGIELWNTPVGFDEYDVNGVYYEGFYYNDGYYTDDGDLGYWEEGLVRGWKLGAAGAEDHRDDEWGSDNYSMAILAESLTRESLYNALKSRRFYSTSDKNIALSFKINDQEMGSTLSGGSNVVQVQVSCNIGDTFEKIVLYKNGIEFHTWSSPVTTNTKEIISSDGDFYYVKVTQTDGDEAISSPIWIEGGPKVALAFIASSLDDVEESMTGSIYHNSSDIELTYDNVNNGGKQIVGLRFSDLNIPQGATINSASIQFTCDESSSDVTNLIFYGHSSDNSPIFTQATSDVSNRSKTNASVGWQPVIWNTVGEQGFAQRSPDLSDIVQEIVNRDAFTPNSSIAFIIEGDGNRVAYSYDGNPQLAPQLTVIYTSNIQSTTGYISSGINDAEEAYGGNIDLSSGDLDMVYDNNFHKNQIVGIRYENLGIPKNATINSANLQFTCDEANGDETLLTIYGHNDDNSTVFSNSLHNITERQKTSASVEWAPEVWNSIGDAGSAQKTSNIGPVIQEIVNRNGYTSSSAISLIIEGLGRRVAYSYDGNSNFAPRLTINFVDPQNYPPINQIKSASISSSNSDAEELSDGSISLVSTDLDLIYDSNNGKSYVVGLRFTDLNIPQGANILSASIQFVCDEPTGDNTMLLIQGHNSGDSPEFSSNNFDLSNRVTTNETVFWYPSIWEQEGDRGIRQLTPDISPVIQEIIDHDDYTSNSAVSLLIEGVGRRIAKSYDAGPSNGPSLSVDYTPNTETVSARIITGNDDVEEFPDGSIHYNSSDLDFNFDNTVVNKTIVGLRFVDLNIPVGAIIRSASIQFTADENTSTIPLLTIHGEYSGNSESFDSLATLSGRNKTQSSVCWKVPIWNNIGDSGLDQFTPDISSIIQEIIDHAEYTSNSAISLFIEGEGDGRRVAESYEGGPNLAANLTVNYTDNVTLPNSRTLTKKTSELEEESKLEELSASNNSLVVSVYPNPVNKDVVFIKTNKPDCLKGYFLFDMSGKTIYNGTFESYSTEIPVSNLNPGIYVVKITSEYGLNTQLLSIK